MLIEERYRAALIALRDGQWEEAAGQLLTIAIDQPGYRDVGGVLEVLQRTRTVAYWCAAAALAIDQQAYEPARAALRQVTILAPDLPRLVALRQALAEIAPPEGQNAPPEAAPHPTSDQPVQDSGNNPLHGLELDPFAELLFDEPWGERSDQPPTPQPDGESDTKKAHSLAPEPAPVKSEAAQKPRPFPTAPGPDTPPVTLAGTEPLVLPVEPAGDFIRITPPVEEVAAPAPAADSALRSTAPPLHRYSLLNGLGLLLFPLILCIVTVYVLFGQGTAPLHVLLREAQTGTAITTAQGLIAAIDAQIARPDAVPNEWTAYVDLGSVLAEETPGLEAALSAWIEAGRALPAARAEVAQACAEPDSNACTVAQQRFKAGAEQAAAQRAAVCALITCPVTPPGSIKN